MDQVGSDHSGHLVQPPCSSRVILKNIELDCIQMVLEYLRGGDPTTALDALFQCMVTHLQTPVCLCLSLLSPPYSAHWLDKTTDWLVQPSRTTFLKTLLVLLAS